MKNVLFTVITLVLLTTVYNLAYGQRAVFIVRHADRLDRSVDSTLSQAGEERAQRFASLLKDAGITAIYTSQRQRTKKTAEPLARALKIQPVIVPMEDHRESLVGRVRADNRADVVLIVSHHSRVPGLLKLFGSPEDVTIARTEYDNLFIVVPRENSPPTVIRLRY